MEITCLWNRKHLKVLYDTKLILNAVTQTLIQNHSIMQKLHRSPFLQTNNWRNVFGSIVHTNDSNCYCLKMSTTFSPILPYTLHQVLSEWASDHIYLEETLSPIAGTQNVVCYQPATKLGAQLDDKAQKSICIMHPSPGTLLGQTLDIFWIHFWILFRCLLETF